MPLSDMLLYDSLSLLSFRAYLLEKESVLLEHDMMHIEPLCCTGTLKEYSSRIAPMGTPRLVMPSRPIQIPHNKYAPQSWRLLGLQGCHSGLHSAIGAAGAGGKPHGALGSRQPQVMRHVRPAVALQPEPQPALIQQSSFLPVLHHLR